MQGDGNQDKRKGKRSSIGAKGNNAAASNMLVRPVMAVFFALLVRAPASNVEACSRGGRTRPTRSWLKGITPKRALTIWSLMGGASASGDARAFKDDRSRQDSLTVARSVILR